MTPATLRRARELIAVEPEPDRPVDAGPSVAPRTPAELHRWIARYVGLSIPQEHVCEAHQAPFDFVAAAYFENISDALVLANRAGGKTHDVACLHLVNAATKPNHYTSHIGAIKRQAERCWSYYRRALTRPDLHELAPAPRVGSTIWRNGSEAEILPGTEAQTQGGHPHLTAFDELEQGRYQSWENAKAMPEEYTRADGTRALGQFIATSTRISGLGLMQRALDEAEQAGTPVYSWCVLETMEPCDGRAGRPPCIGEACPIATWCIGSDDAAGQREDFAAAVHHCEDDATLGLHGRVVHADGWRSYAQIMRVFGRSGIDTWLAQHLCLRPEAKALIYSPFSPANITEAAAYIPGAGPIYLAGDWGFTDPAHFVLFQLRESKSGLLGLYGFAEFVGSQTSELDWARAIVRYLVAMESYDGPTFEEWERIWAGDAEWPSPFPEVWVLEAAIDPSAVQLRRVLRTLGIGAPSKRRTGHRVAEGQDVLRAAILAGGGRRLFLDPRTCPVTIQHLSAYRARELDDGSFGELPDPDPANHRFSHGTDALRYLAWMLRRRLGLAEFAGVVEEGSIDE